MTLSIPHPEHPSDPLHDLYRAVARRPRSAVIRYDLAIALYGADDPAEAIKHCCAALAAQPSLHSAARLLASMLLIYAIDDEIEIAPRGLEAAMAYSDVSCQALSVAALDWLKLQPPLAGALALGHERGWDAAAEMAMSKKGRRLIQDRLFLAALTKGVNTDIEVEMLLTALRRYLLLSATPELFAVRRVYEFVCVMIQQCANNDYVFFTSRAERDYLSDLDFDVDGILAGATETVANFLRASLYRPVHESVSAAAAGAGFEKVAPRALREVLRTQLDIRLCDAERTKTIERITEISDATSQLVAGQYAVNPYPKWFSTQTPEPGIAANSLLRYFSASELEILGGGYDVLIAGAGTGRQAVNSAISHGPAAKVLAIDLSAPSLAFGDRMASQLGVENLCFAQADILGLGNIEQFFDVIECCGVLHHMAEPYEGWRILADRLRPGGLMMIGLYSAVARRDIQELRDDPACPNGDADDDALRAFRVALMSRAKGEPGAELKVSEDFFVKSSFRDLALHVSEQHCAIPEIKSFMAENGLVFHGFSLSDSTLADYAEAYPGDWMPGDLDHWCAFENDRPHTFDGMYTFWCRKP